MRPDGSPTATTDGIREAVSDARMEELARASWRPRLADDMYVSLTSSLAFSPTDAMPLSIRAKSLMSLETLISTLVVLFVIARAINVLN